MDTNMETLRLMATAVAEERDRLRSEYNAVIDYAIEADDPAAFLRTWRDGDTETLANEWPDFKAYNDETPGDCANRLEYLRELGYKVPQYAVDALREEADEQG